LIVIAMGIAAALPFLLLISQISIPIGFGAALKLKITPVAVLASAAVVLAANLLGALAPAYRASRLNIVDALRYE
ncbi:MAG: ABC transporter permease, partial [Pyrobaculum sp.]